MIPVYQSTTGGPQSAPRERGDCLSACFASILELPLAEVPRFCELDREKQGDAMMAWLRPFGLAVICFGYSEEWGRDVMPHLGYSILSGRSPRGPYLHAVVALGNRIVHDPFVVSEPPHFLPHTPADPWLVEVLVPLNPMFVRRHKRPEMR